MSQDIGPFQTIVDFNFGSPVLIAYIPMWYFIRTSQDNIAERNAAYQTIAYWISQYKESTPILGPFTPTSFQGDSSEYAPGTWIKVPVPSAIAEDGSVINYPDEKYFIHSADPFEVSEHIFEPSWNSIPRYKIVPYSFYFDAKSDLGTYATDLNDKWGIYNNALINQGDPELDVNTVGIGEKVLGCKLYKVDFASLLATEISYSDIKEPIVKFNRQTYNERPPGYWIESPLSNGWFGYDIDRTAAGYDLLEIKNINLFSKKYPKLTPTWDKEVGFFHAPDYAEYKWANQKTDLNFVLSASATADNLKIFHVSNAQGTNHDGSKWYYHTSLNCGSWVSDPTTLQEYDEHVFTWQDPYTITKKDDSKQEYEVIDVGIQTYTTDDWKNGKYVWNSPILAVLNKKKNV